MNAAHKRELRPEEQWEVIRYPGGTYVARRVATVELVLDLTDTTAHSSTGAVIVIETHDLGLAAATAWPVWTRHQDGPLTAPLLHWWRRQPAEEITGYRQDYDYSWWPAQPGSPGAQPLVEFPFHTGATRLPTPPWLTATTMPAPGVRGVRGDQR